MALTTRSDPRILVGDTGEGLGTLHNEPGSVEEVVSAEAHYSNYDSN
jgi:hypothetical protein